MELSDLKKWNIAYRICKSFNHKPIIKKLETLHLGSTVKFVKKQIKNNAQYKYNPLLEKYQVGFIDFEGSPVFLCGLMIKDTLITYYIENNTHRDDLFLVILEALNRANELIFFGFSEYEKIELLKIFQCLQSQGYSISSYNFIKTLPIINLQKDKFESFAEAIYSLNLRPMNITGDSLFRNIKLINELFIAQKFDEIIAHNHNCLINASVIFLNRWLKYYNISGESRKIH